MTPRLVVGCLLLCVGVNACVTASVARPPAKAFQLGAMKGEYRSFAEAQVDPCRTDARWLKQDFDALADVLAEFLNQTSAGFEGIWSDEQLGLLEEGQKVLPPVLDATIATVERAQSCDFDENVRMNETLPRITEFSAQAKKRLHSGPELLAHARARRELDQWRANDALKKEEQRAAVCKRSKAKKVFHASEDETGVKSWSFCDGQSVMQAPGDEPRLAESDMPAPKKPLPYFEAAMKFPAEDVHRAPKVPLRAAQQQAEPERFDLDQPIDGD